MYGGGYFYNIRKGSEKSCNIIAYLTDTSETFKLFQRNKRLLLNGGDNGKQLHITLLNILFNKDAPQAIKDVLLDAQDNIKPHIATAVSDLYSDLYKANAPILIDGTIGESYVIKGEWIAKVLDFQNPSDRDSISKFRRGFYHLITNEFLQRGYRLNREENKQNHTVTSVVAGPGIYHPIEIYAVPSYYYGQGVITPHVSLCSIPDIKLNNRRLYDDFELECITLAGDKSLHEGLTASKKQLDIGGGQMIQLYEESGLILESMGKLVDGIVRLDMSLYDPRNNIKGDIDRVIFN